MTIRQKIEQAKLAVEGHLLRHAPTGLSPKIYTYNDEVNKRPLAGCIVSEVSFISNSGGCSYMQVDLPWGLAVCAQVERCILAIAEGWEKEEIDEEFARLDLCFNDHP